MDPVLPAPTPLGVLSVTGARGRDVVSFTHDDARLGGAAGRVLDPALRLHAGPQYPGRAQPSFGVFLDCSPIAGAGRCSTAARRSMHAGTRTADGAILDVNANIRVQHVTGTT